MTDLFSPLQLGSIALPNRIIMAPLTRCRADSERAPTQLMAEYYAQRSSAGLIISEATSISPQGVGYPRTPGLWTEQQVAGWTTVTKAVHEAGGRIVAQLWHVGRISDPEYLNGDLPVAPSALPAEGHVRLLRPKRPYPTPRALGTDEISGIVEDYRKAAENAKKAGFDGVHLHAANGYLIDQFLQDSTNRRTDRYGGSIENRARFLLEIVDALTSVWGENRIGVHLRPRGEEHDMGDSDPVALFEYVVTELRARKAGFLFIRETQGTDSQLSRLKSVFGGPVIANDEFSPTDAEQVVEEGTADAVAFGRLFIANPDLVERLKAKEPFNAPDPKTFYASGPEGYTDYPKINEKI
ncbi:alkene reductase [Gluconobacter sp. P5B12]|uniref:alkene reductase n=1 Tax=unclassified Gluconobacter TaxID=2644261 RepID=UPI001C041AFB|nr:alkene reductase [Gluconobacter sp. P5B12]